MRRQYIITITDKDPIKRTAMRNALYRLGGSEWLPGLWSVALTESERQALAKRFGGYRIRGG